MNYLPQLPKIHNLAKKRLDELNAEMNHLIAEQISIAETLCELITEMENHPG